MSLHNAERQVAPDLSGIRRDHVARYEWAAARLPADATVIDIACGVGYGAHLLAGRGCKVHAVDRDLEALDYARQHWAHERIAFKLGDATRPESILFPVATAAVCFETLEHLENPRPLLRRLAEVAPQLLASVPNEDVFPHCQGGRTIAHHFRHYTRAEFAALLAECGWTVASWWGQLDGESEVDSGMVDGRTLVAHCVRSADRAARTWTREADQAKPVAPPHVAILGLGPSLEQFVNVTKRMGGRHAYCDEVWGINAVAGVLQCDRVFHMDDVRVQEVRAAAAPESNIARMLDWMRAHPGPIVTSRAHPDYPGLVEFPLAGVLDQFRHGYFNSTAAYAVAYAVWLGVQKISLFGIDFSYPNAHDAEKGRACVEWWLGVAAQRGIKIAIAKQSALMDALGSQADRLYGYDTVDVAIATDEAGRVRCTFSERDVLPTADEIEDRYDHSRHPNALVEEGAS